MSYQAVMDMPVKAFWMMTGMIPRVAAEYDIRELSVSVHAQLGESAMEFRKSLEKAMGKIVIEEEVLDLDGWNSLKTLAG